ncbi:MAG: hypothetical protein Q8M39_09485 [Sulfuricurvum sp.]|nr:hypothetical protein [Methylotenera sp.]MDP2072272.1 hypothetical protein [Methylotenera sp.]MDP2231039.1 hypothetical protein [Methylotenera sp.]MDP3005071.1 hypothetical protein [Methylotenera sp.]MDP3267048.1 hypothetical protein [Sulfuricurvum sp.]
MSSANPKYAGKFSRKALPPAIQYYQTENMILKGAGAWHDALRIWQI